MRFWLHQSMDVERKMCKMKTKMKGLYQAIYTNILDNNTKWLGLVMRSNFYSHDFPSRVCIACFFLINIRFSFFSFDGDIVLSLHSTIPSLQFSWIHFPFIAFFKSPFASTCHIHILLLHLIFFLTDVVKFSITMTDWLLQLLDHAITLFYTSTWRIKISRGQICHMFPWEGNNNLLKLWEPSCIQRFVVSLCMISRKRHINQIPRRDKKLVCTRSQPITGYIVY